MSIKTPLNQKRLTNVAVCRLNKNGKRFEVAAYPSKVQNYRQGVEDDLDEVLQSDRIFVNVGKGEFAPNKLLRECFGTEDSNAVAEEILKKGTLQSSGLERAHNTNMVTSSVVDMLTTRCVDPGSGRPYTETMIRQKLVEIGWAPMPTKPAKVSFLEAVKALQGSGFAIERAKIRARLFVKGDKGASSVGERLGEFMSTLSNIQGLVVEKKGDIGAFEAIILTPPSAYRDLQNLCSAAGLGVDVIQQNVVNCDTQGAGVGAGAADADDASAVAVKALSLDNRDEMQRDMPPVAVDSSNSMPPLPPTVEDDDEESEEIFTNKKDRKKAQRKSKKAARRQKEKDAEMAEKLEKEKQRVKERAERLESQGKTKLKQSQDAANASDGLGSSASGSTTKQAMTANTKQHICNTCKAQFGTLQLFRAHYKSDWHRYNLSLKSSGVETVSEMEFKIVDSDELFLR